MSNWSEIYRFMIARREVAVRAEGYRAGLNHAADCLEVTFLEDSSAYDGTIEKIIGQIREEALDVQPVQRERGAACD